MTTSKQAPGPEVAAVINRVFPKLRRWFARQPVPAADAQDLAQESIAVLLKKDIDALDHPEKYLWGIAHNKMKQYWDRKRRDREFDVRMMSARELSTTLGTKLDRASRIGEAMRDLTMEQKDALEFRYGEGLKLTEVAEATGRSLASIKRDIKAGLDKMREVLGTMDGDEDLGLKLGADYRRG